MERLSFDLANNYSSIEAAIHINRYLLCKNLCTNKRVLDVACGEGYGAYIMMTQWGAKSVDAIDISAEAIDKAKSTFSHDKINYHCGSAEKLAELLPDQGYDLIVSLGTIEHLVNPKKFLQDLKKLIKPDGIIIISCPNDHWYYPKPIQSNPYHYRKYTFTEFQQLTENILGKAHNYLMGTGLSGFANLSLTTPQVGHSQIDMLKTQALKENVLVPITEAELPNEKNCSYFVGMWGPVTAEVNSATFYVQSLDSFQNNQELEELRNQIAIHHKLYKDSLLQLQAIKAENEFLKERVFNNPLSARSLTIKNKALNALNRIGIRLIDKVIEIPSFKKIYYSCIYKGYRSTLYLIINKIYHKFLGFFVKKNQAKVNQTITNSESEQELSDDSLPEKMDYFFASNHALLFTNQNQKIGVNGSNLTISFLSLNRHKLSLKLLNSIAENMPDFQGEILIIDNGSDKQELLEIKSACAKLNFKYRIIELESNIGVSCGRNKALSLALTDWVMCLDNDIYFINNPLDIIQREISISGCHFFNLPLLDADGHNIFARGGHLYLSRHHSNILVGAGSVYTNETTTTIKDTHFFFSTFLFGGASIINRHTFLKYGGYDEALFVGFEDIDFSIRIFQEGLKVGNLSCLSLIHDHAKPEEVIDKNYEAKRFSREALYNSAIHLEKKHGLKFWHQGIDDWLESKNKTLEL